MSSVVSVNFGSPTATNKVDLSQGLALRDAIGPLATLDEALVSAVFLAGSGRCCKVKSSRRCRD